jgi:acyl-CoA reductase-like NAD-dependent aldehyde dehydrogenase
MFPQLQRVFFKLQHLIRAHTDELAFSITTEQGKTIQDAKGDVFRGLEVRSCIRTYIYTCLHMYVRIRTYVRK